MTRITEEQVERVAKALYNASLSALAAPWSGTCASHDYFMSQARIALEAAQEPQRPQWPTDKSVRAGWPYLVDVEPQRDNLRLAMLADPIIQAAVQHVKVHADPGDEVCDQLVRAVRAAGLDD